MGAILNRTALGFAIVTGAVFSQLPEFAQQYRQRLGGALDELTQIVAQFDADAARQKMTPDQALAALATNPEPLARDRGAAMSDTIARKNRLSRQARAYAEAGAVGRIIALARDYDPKIARGAWAIYEPALPTTPEGAAFAGAGALGGYSLFRSLGLLFKRRRKTANVRGR